MLATRALLISLGQLLARAAELLVAILLVRLLSPTEWAGIALLLSLYTAALGLAGFGLPEGMLFFLGRMAREERRGFVVQTALLLAGTGLLAAGVLLAIAPVVARGPFPVGGLVPLVALAVLLEVPALAAPQILVAEERIGGAAAYYAGVAALRLSAVSLPILLGYGVRGAVSGLVLSGLLKLLLLILLTALLTAPGPWVPRGESIRRQLAFTAPLGLAIGAAALNTGLGKWFVGLWAPAQLGAYAIAATQVPVIPILAVASGTVIATRMVHAFRHQLIPQAAAYWRAGAARMVVLVAPLSLGIVLGAGPLLALLFGPRYPAAVLPFQLYTLILLNRIADHGSTLRAAGDTGALWRASLLLLAANFAFGIPLTRELGMVGTAIASLLAQGISWLYMLSRIARATGSTLATVVPWRLYALSLALAGAATGGAALAARAAPAGPALQLAVRWGVFVAGYAAGARLLGLWRRLPAIPEDHASFRAAEAA